MAEREAPDGAETGLEEMRTSVLSEWLGTCSLAFVPEGRTVTVSRVAADEARERLGALGIERGVSIECVRHDVDRVVVTVRSGLEVSLDRRDAWVLQVTPSANVPAGQRGPDRSGPGRLPRWLRGPKRRDP